MIAIETICTFMEPRPTKGPFDFRPWRSVSPGGWWRAMAGEKQPKNPDNWPNEWIPRDLTLNALWEAEERLTREQKMKYNNLLMQLRGNEEIFWGWHATPGQKIRALAAALRPEGK